MFFLRGLIGLFLSSKLTETITMKRVLQMKKDSLIKSNFPHYKPKTVNQEIYQSVLMDPSINIVVVLGPAGTGKTMLACNNAIRELKAGKISKIIITRPVVPVEEDIGYLPGNINKKMDPWMKPIFDIFLDFYTQREIDTMMQNNIIEISPLAYMRGRTFKDSMIIADEMQNSSPNQMLMLATRIGLNSKMVITGDLKQTDKPGLLSGLFDIVQKYRAYMKLVGEDYKMGIKLVELNHTDIERHPVIETVLKIYESSEPKTTDIDCAIIPKRQTRDFIL